VTVAALRVQRLPNSLSELLVVPSLHVPRRSSVKRVGLLLGTAVLLAALGWALDIAAVPINQTLPVVDRGPEPIVMALGALGLLAIGAALKRRG